MEMISEFYIEKNQKKQKKKWKITYFDVYPLLLFVNVYWPLIMLSMLFWQLREINNLQTGCENSPLNISLQKNNKLLITLYLSGTLASIDLNGILFKKTLLIILIIF